MGSTSVAVAVSRGTVSNDQGCGEDAYAAGSARQHPLVHSHQRRQVHDVNILDPLIPEAGAFYVMDRGYIDFARLYRLHQAGSFLVTRAKKNRVAQRRYSHPVGRSRGVIVDQTLVLQGYQSVRDYPESLRGVRYKDPETGKRQDGRAGRRFCVPRCGS